MTTATDPLEGLVALGVITREQLKEAAKVDPEIATTVVGRLVAVGVSAPELLQALSKLTDIPLATREQLDSIGRMDGFSGVVERGLRDLPAAPMSRAADGTVDILIAEPQAAKRVGPFIARHRLFLALELDVRDAVERAIPELVDDDDFADAASAPAPVQPAGPALDDARGTGSAISVIRASTQPAPAPQDTPPAEHAVDPPRAHAPVEDQPTPMERVKPIREKFAPGVKRQDLVAPVVAPIPAPHVPALERPRTESRPMPVADKPSSRAPIFVGALVVVGLGVAAVFVPGLLKGGPPAAPVDELAIKQQKGLDEARAFAAKADHAWAITRCSDVVTAGPTTALGHQAALLCAEQRVLLGERAEGLEDLQHLIDGLRDGDPLRAEAEAVKKRLQL